MATKQKPNPRAPLPVPIATILKYVDDATYLFITTTDGKRLDVCGVTYHTVTNSLEIKCGDNA